MWSRGRPPWCPAAPPHIQEPAELFSSPPRLPLIALVAHSFSPRCTCESFNVTSWDRSIQLGFLNECGLKLCGRGSTTKRFNGNNDPQTMTHISHPTPKETIACPQSPPCPAPPATPLPRPLQGSSSGVMVRGVTRLALGLLLGCAAATAGHHHVDVLAARSCSGSMLRRGAAGQLLVTGAPAQIRVVKQNLLVGCVGFGGGVGWGGG